MDRWACVAMNRRSKVVFRRLSFSGSGTERGSVVPLVAVMLFVAMLAMVSIGAVARQSVQIARAQWAADAAALAVTAAGVDGAGVTEAGAVAGELTAEANGATLLSVSTVSSHSALRQHRLIGHGSSPDTGHTTSMSFVVVVEVERDGIKASAAAARFFSIRP